MSGMTMAVVLSVGMFSFETMTLNDRLSRDEARVQDISDLFARHRDQALSRDDLGSISTRLESALSSTVRRVAALEARSRAVTQIIAAASPSVVFLQGAYGFVESETGRPLRHAVGPNGQPIRTPYAPVLTVNGTGPVFEARVTGTAFVVTRDRLLITSHHVASPWETYDVTDLVANGGLEPVVHRFVGYLPGSEEPFEVQVQSVDRDADVAILRSASIPPDTPYLELAALPPHPGDEVVVMGYPTGMRALLARADSRFIEELDGDADFWSLGRRLARARHINPLATRGIVGQVTAAAIVYDADTAEGGSGGPVLGLDGRVLAINSAVVPEFTGSNLGVPIDPARQMLVCMASGAPETDPAGVTSPPRVFSANGTTGQDHAGGAPHADSVGGGEASPTCVGSVTTRTDATARPPSATRVTIAGTGGR